MFDLNMQIYADALAVREQQISLTSANIANRDTPDYKARGIDFQSALKSAEFSTSRQVGLTTESDRHLNISEGKSSYNIQFREAVSPKADGNTVDISGENARFAEYTTQYTLALEMLSSTKNSRITAIKGK